MGVIATVMIVSGLRKMLCIKFSFYMKNRTEFSRFGDFDEMYMKFHIDFGEIPKAGEI